MSWKDILKFASTSPMVSDLKSAIVEHFGEKYSMRYKAGSLAGEFDRAFSYLQNLVKHSQDFPDVENKVTLQTELINRLIEKHINIIANDEGRENLSPDEEALIIAAEEMRDEINESFTNELKFREDNV